MTSGSAVHTRMNPQLRDASTFHPWPLVPHRYYSCLHEHYIVHHCMFARDPEMRSQAVAAPLFCGLIEAVVIGIFCLWAWKAGWTKAPRDEALCVVVAKSYEVDDNAMRDDDDDDDDDMVELQHQDDDKQVKEAATNSRCWPFWKKRTQVTPDLTPTVDHDFILDGDSQCGEPSETTHD